MNSQKASEKLTFAIKYNNGKIATTQLEQIMIAMLEPSKRAVWSSIIKLSLTSHFYADTIFSLEKIDNCYHQILSIRNPRNGEIAWRASK